MSSSSRAVTPVRRWRGRSASERTAERRERLIAAGLEVFARRGYSASTVRDVCREAGLTERYFYESFRNREALLGALADRIVDEALEAVAPALADPARDLEEIVRDALGRFVGSLVDDPRRAQLLLVETVGVSPPAEDRRREIMGQLADVTRQALAQALGAAAPDPPDVDLTARALIGASNELLVGYIRGELSVDRDQLTSHLTALFLSAAPLSSARTREPTDGGRSTDAGPAPRGTPAADPTRPDPRRTRWTLARPPSV
jgi:AcrR family transcriptional regulator